jgi:hypothetical protein
MEFAKAPLELFLVSDLLSEGTWTYISPLDQVHQGFHMDRHLFMFHAGLDLLSNWLQVVELPTCVDQWVGHVQGHIVLDLLLRSFYDVWILLL